MAGRIGPRFATSLDYFGRRWQKNYATVTTYRNGDVIPQVTDPTEWINLTTGAWCYYNNDSANDTTYGKLYNGYAITDPRGIAPYGYRCPKLITRIDSDPIQYSDFITRDGFAWFFAQPGNETPDPYLQTTFSGLRSGNDGSFYGIDSFSYFGLSDVITEQNAQVYFYVVDSGNGDYETASDQRTVGYTVWFIEE
jgi:hypothetical protein